MRDQTINGQWVARNRRGKVIATAPTAHLIVATLVDMGLRANGATAKFERDEIGGA